MDRNVITATILITLIMMVWFYFLTPPIPPPDQAVSTDTTQVVSPGEPLDASPLDEPVQSEQVAAITDSTIAGAQQGEERIITVDTDLYEAKLSTKGGTLVSFLLKTYKMFDQETPVQLVDTTKGGALSLFFTTPASHNIDTRSFYFDSDLTSDNLSLSQEGQQASIRFTTDVGQGQLHQTYTFTQGSYEVGLRIEQENALSFATREGYDLVWDGGVPFSEDNPAQESIKTGAFVRSAGGDVTGVTLDKDSYEEESILGETSWVGVKNQYFAVAVMPQGNTRGAELIGERIGEAGAADVIEEYEARLLMPAADNISDEFKLYIGPMEYARISDYGVGLYDMVDYGWDFFEWITRPVAKFVFIPAFNVLSGFIPNYGVIIIILAFFIKAVVYPLTKKSYRSMAQMRELQPKIEAIKEKYSDNPQKQQEATMKLYKESGTNPLGGCLPMFFQYPIIIALWQFLPQSIEIRQQGFLWAQDLSAPDIILNLPFNIPVYGDFVAGFCFLMGLSMIVQMRIQATPTAGAQAKMLMYMMPGMIFLIFNKWASGLNLYYLCYNILTAIQQRFINKSIEREKEEAKLNGTAGGGRKKSKKPTNNKRSKNGAQQKKRTGKKKPARSRR